MKTVKGIRCYEEIDLIGGANLVSVILDAKHLWEARCKQYMTVYGDCGSCVLGAGISINFIPKGKRTPRRLQVIRAMDICRAQGSLVWEDSKDEVLRVFERAGIEVFYNWGNMD